jgi:polyisoprenoid-binding protein YceI
MSAPYRLDPTHSFVHAEVDHFGTTTMRLRIGPIDGDVDFDRAAQRGYVGLRIATARISSGVPPLDSRLREPDLFSTAEHPEAFYVAERFVFDRARLVEVHGEFTLRGTSRPLSLRAVRFNCYLNPIFKREVCGGDFEGEILRSEYGMRYLLPFVGDRVRLLVTVEAVAQ